MDNFEEKEMSFLEHLEELRWHLVRSVVAILIFAVTAFFNKYIVFHVIILGPSRPDFLTYRLLCRLGNYLGIESLCMEKMNFIIQSRTMTGQFTTHITISFICGIIIAFPYVFWEIWRFIRPGLYSKEQNMTRGAVFFVSVLFLTGILFGYYVLSPMSINFLANYTIDDSIENQFDLLSYINTLTMMVLSCGILFQLPMVVYVLAKIGLISSHFMQAYRRHSIVVILFLAAILTPSPDMFSQLIVAIPIYGLYEASIFIAKRVESAKAKASML